MTQVAEPGSAHAERRTPGRVSHWIGGRHVAGTSGREGPVYDPATGAITKYVDFASADEVGAAVAAAKAAFPAWRATSISKRTEIMFRIRNLVESAPEGASPPPHRRARQGPVRRARRDRPRPREPRVRVRHPAACSRAASPSRSRAASTSTRSASRSAWWPASRRSTSRRWSRCGCSPTAIAAGNTFILKPSEKDPSAANFLAELLAEAGVPDGVFNVVHGDKVAVDAILEHPDIAAVSFVGSTPIARYIYETGTKAGKRVQALGGAKNHMIVLPDADIDMAADAAVSAGYGSAGERCMAIATIVAVGDVADPLVEAIKARLPKIKVGPGSDPASEMGPLVTRQHRDKVASYLDSGPAQGATVVADGREHPLYDESDGFFLGVSLIDHVTPAMDAYSDEIFGPVLTVMRVKTYEEAVQPHQRQPVRQRHGDLHPRRRRGAPVPVRGQRGDGRHQRADPGAGRRTTASVAGRTRCSATCTCTAPRASSSTRGPRSSPRAGRIRAPARSISGSRARAERARP